MVKIKIGARKEAERIENRGRKVILLGVVIFLLGLLLSLVSVIFLGVIVSVSGFIISRPAETWKKGARGEEKVISELEELEDKYKVFNDLVLPTESSNIDHVVLSKGGICVIETKNMGGKIRCEGDSWERTKTGRRGTEYQGKIGCPSKQVKGNAVKLKDFLKEKCPEIFENKNLFFEGIVVFTDPEVELELSSPTVDVIRVKELRKTIKRKGSNVFGKGEVRRISRVLKRDLN